MEKVKTIPMKGGVHNTYVTPDGRFIVAGSVVGKILTVIDRKTEQPVWELRFDNGVRPIAFETNADGSTKTDVRAAFERARIRGGGLCRA